jgi:hypothetical protein
VHAIDEAFDDRDMGDVRFARNRALKLLGAALFGLATSAAMRQDIAAAYHKKAPPCGPSGRCHCCSGTSCCSSGCSPRTGQCPRAGSSQNSWLVCHAGHSHRCTDYWDARRRPCICRGTYDTGCGLNGGGGCATGTDYGFGVFAASAGETSTDMNTFGVEINSGTYVWADAICAGTGLTPPAATSLVQGGERTLETWENHSDRWTDPDPALAGDANYYVNNNAVWDLISTICNAIGNPPCVCDICLSPQP